MRGSPDVIVHLGWLAAALGWAGSWVCGHKHRFGWVLAFASSAAWVAMNAGVGIWPGAVSSSVSALLAVRNWFAWRSSSRLAEPRKVPATDAADLPEDEEAA